MCEQQQCNTCKHCGDGFICKSADSIYWGDHVLYKDVCECYEPMSKAQKHHSARWYKQQVQDLSLQLAYALEKDNQDRVRELRMSIKEAKAGLKQAKLGKKLSIKERNPLAFPDAEFCFAD